MRCALLATSLLPALVLALPARADDAATPAPAEIEFFEKKIRPLLQERCGECHSKQTGDKNGELFLDAAAGIRKGGSRGTLLLAGKPEESLLIKAVRYADEELQMPPAGKLADAEIQRLIEWVRRGAALPNETAAAESTRRIDIEAGKNFWSFRPLQPADVPAIKNPAWPRTRTDVFLLAKLEAAGMKPAVEADRRTLIRRLSFDLAGLPPTADEVDAFLADERPDAYETLVERLLLSPHFGERMARDWLDLARYTDSTAWWLNSAENAWLYRDWVVRAMNEDRPYDDFVRRQLAADQMPDSPPADLAAVGFLGLSPTYWKELRLAPHVIEAVVAEEWDERIDAVSRTFLGLTVACARCHDHKFDPVTTKDYYALAGVFASCQLTERPLVPDAEAGVLKKARGQLKAWDAELKKIKDMNSEPARQLQAKIDDLRRTTPGVDLPFAHVMEEASVYVLPDGADKTKVDIRPGDVRDVPVFRRGSPTNPGEIVPRRFLAVLSPGEPQKFQHGSGRLELANAIVTNSQALAARVIVNRIWTHHFGRGLVRTVSDFGNQGERPTHPELLDDLSRRFIEHGWSLRWLHREMVLSSAYRQSSKERIADGAASQPATLNPPGSVDPDNRLLGRMPRRRLEVEAWRDALLAGTGQFVETMGGPSTPLDSLQNVRRTLYGTVSRHEQNDMLRLYDFPEPSSHSPNRMPTTTPLQQLFVLNSPFVTQSADKLANAALSGAERSTRQRIEASYRALLQRNPTTQELALGETFLADCAAAKLAPLDAWRLYAHALLGLNELMFVD